MFSWATLTERGKIQAGKSGLAASFESYSYSSAKIAVLEKKQARPAKAGEQKMWEDITGEEEIIESNAAELKDGQSVEVTSGKLSR